MINILLDILIYNFTFYNSYFFLTNVSDKNIVYNIFLAVFLEVLTGLTGFLLMIVLLMIIVLKIFRLRLDNICCYYGFFISFIMLFSIFTSGCSGILVTFIINSLYVLISYKLSKTNIALIG